MYDVHIQVQMGLVHVHVFEYVFVSVCEDFPASLRARALGAANICARLGCASSPLLAGALGPPLLPLLMGSYKYRVPAKRFPVSFGLV